MMQFEWIQIPYALLTLFIVFNYGFLLTAFIQKIGARVGRRHGIPIWQNYVDLIKNYGQRSSITHGVMFYLGPVFRLAGGLGLILFVPTIYGSDMFSNFSFAGDLILVLYFVFFGTLGMALGAGESGHPHAAIGVSRGLSQVTAAELPFAMAIFAIALQYETLSITEIVAAQQGGFSNWTLFTNPSGCDCGNDVVSWFHDAPTIRCGTGTAGNSDRPANRISLHLPGSDADQPRDFSGCQSDRLYESVFRRCG